MIQLLSSRGLGARGWAPGCVWSGDKGFAVGWQELSEQLCHRVRALGSPGARQLLSGCHQLREVSPTLGEPSKEQNPRECCGFSPTGVSDLPAQSKLIVGVGRLPWLANAGENQSCPPCPRICVSSSSSPRGRYPARTGGKLVVPLVCEPQVKPQCPILLGFGCTLVPACWCLFCCVDSPFA